MKLVKTLSKKYKIIITFIIFLFITIPLSIYVTKIIERSKIIEKYKIITPAQKFNSDENFVSKIYFNSTLGEETSLDPIVDIIKNAKNTIEIAMFSFDSQKLQQALYSASEKGVKITLILDSSRELKHNAVFNNLPNNIKRIDLGNFDKNNSTNTVYMHHKLLIVDRGFKTEKIITGSMDYTSKGEKYEQSFFLVTEDKTLAKIYEKEMNLLKKGLHGDAKLKEKEYSPLAASIQYADSYMEVWMSPGFDKNSIKYKIIDEISKAKKNINIIMWQFTDRKIADELIKKAQESISIKIITEDLVANDKSSSIPYLKEKIAQNKLTNIEIILDTKSNTQIDLSKLSTGFSPFIHHHFMVIDNEKIIFGTNNWSIWGFYKNDEDTIFTDNKYLVNEFQKTFDHFYKTLK